MNTPVYHVITFYRLPVCSFNIQSKCKIKTKHYWFTLSPQENNCSYSFEVE